MNAGEPPDSRWRDVLRTRPSWFGISLFLPVASWLAAAQFGWVGHDGYFGEQWTLFLAAIAAATVGVVCLAVAFFRAGRDL